MKHAGRRARRHFVERLAQVNYKKSMTAVALLALGGLCSAAAAEDAQMVNRALHCSAIFTVFVDTHAADPALQTRFARGVEIFTGLYAKERGGDPAAMRQEAATQRAALLRQLHGQLKERELYLREDGVICGAWAEGFFAQGENYTFVPVYPKVIGMGVRSTYAKIAADAFSRWQP